MRVKLTTGRVGMGWSQAPGQVVEVPEAEGRRLLESLQAEPALEPKAAGAKAPANPARK